MFWKKDWILEQLEVITIGLPFCLFKIFTALVLWRLGHPLLAGILFTVGVVDLAVNGGNLLSLMARRKRLWPPCILTIILKSLGKKNSSGPWANVGTSLDVMLSMILVAAMLGAGGLHFLNSQELAFWNYSVVLNVLGAGLARLATSLRQLAQDSGHP